MQYRSILSVELPNTAEDIVHFLGISQINVDAVGFVVGLCTLSAILGHLTVGKRLCHFWYRGVCAFTSSGRHTFTRRTVIETRLLNTSTTLFGTSLETQRMESSSVALSSPPGSPELRAVLYGLDASARSPPRLALKRRSVGKMGDDYKAHCMFVSSVLIPFVCISDHRHERA
jgi:hypothetical protein